MLSALPHLKKKKSGLSRRHTPLTPEEASKSLWTQGQLGLHSWDMFQKLIVKIWVGCLPSQNLGYGGEKSWSSRMSFFSYKVQGQPGPQDPVSKNKQEAGGTVQWIRALAILGDLGSILNTPHGSSQPAVTPAPGNLTPSSGLWEHQVHTVTYRHTCRQNTHTK